MNVTGSVAKVYNILSHLGDLADHYRGIYVETSGVYCTFVAIWATFFWQCEIAGILNQQMCGTFQVKKVTLHTHDINTLKAMLIVF